MTERLGYLLAHSFRLASSQAMATTDDRGSGVSRTVAAGWYRVLLAAGTGNSHSDPAELLAAVEAALDAAKWSVSMGTDGRARFTYLGSGTGTISFSSATILRAVLGLTGNIGPLNTNEVGTADYKPTHAIFACACDPDTGWVDAAGRFAGSELPEGEVYGWNDGRVTFRRAATFRLLPKDSTFASSLQSPATLAFPARSRWRNPASGDPGQTPPWAAIDTLATGFSVECGVVWGDLQSVLSGTVTTYDLAYLAPQMASSGSRISLSTPNYDARRDFSVELLFAGEGTL